MKINKIVITGLIILLLAASMVWSLEVKTFTIKEGDLIKVVPNVVDPDNDLIRYYFPPPLDNNGEWQTTYKDAGEYNLEIGVSDGVNQQIEKIKLIVQNVNQPPKIITNHITINETQTIDLKKIIKDEDGDALSYIFSAPFDKSGVWKTNYGDAGSFVTNIRAYDGEVEIRERIEVEVLPINEPPRILDSFSNESLVKVNEDEELYFFVEADDDEIISYSWLLDGKEVSDKRSGRYYFNFTSEGDYVLILILSDGFSNFTQEWSLMVENTNRPPEVKVLPSTINEGEKLTLNLPKRDADNDTLTYSFEAPLDQNGTWQTTFEDAGEHEIDFTVTDGKVMEKKKIIITVINVDRAPMVNIPDKLYAKEGEYSSWTFDLTDLDGDALNVTISNLPDGAKYDARTKTLSWTPDYDTIKRKGGRISNILNTLRLESLFLRAKKIPITITACSKNLCSDFETKIMIENVNRAPKLEDIPTLTLKEDQVLKVEPQATDLDGDIVHYYFTSPLDRKGEFAPDYDEEGDYTAYITATDGKMGDTKAVKINVLKNNQIPKLDLEDDEFIVNEGQEFSFKVSATDPDEDPVIIVIENMPQGASFKDGYFSWKPGFDTVLNKSESWINSEVTNSEFLNKKLGSDESVVWLRFIAKDEESEVIAPVKLIVKNVNQPPQILDSVPNQDLTVFVNTPIVFSANVVDLDQDALQYHWEFGPGNGRVEGATAVQRIFTSPGEKEVRLTVSDGSTEVEKIWKVNVVQEANGAVEVPAKEQAVLPSQEPFTIGVYVIERKVNLS